jgi:hypothetical protein
MKGNWKKTRNLSQKKEESRKKTLDTKEISAALIDRYRRGRRGRRS